jgi:hypothetical protein
MSFCFCCLLCDLAGKHAAGYSHGMLRVEPEGRRRTSKTAGERRRRGRVPPWTPGAEDRRLRPSARRAPGQERRGEALGSESTGCRYGIARIGGGAEAEAKYGGTARCVVRVW